jgi:hypothetical protein
MQTLGLLLLFLTVFPNAQAAGRAQQMNVADGQEVWTFTYSWRDGSGSKENTQFKLAATPLQQDLSEPTWLPRRDLNGHMAKAVRTWAKTLPKHTKVKVDAINGGLNLRVTGPRKSARAALKEADQVAAEAQEEWLDAHLFTTLKSGDVSFDHALLANAYAEDLAPIAAALEGDTRDTRAFIERTLSFVQAIPYEARKKRGGDPGYRRPLALLKRNRGDCDSKAVLFLGILRTAYPDLDLAVVYVPGHALVGVGLEPEKGDRTFRSEGRRYVYAEPVGPALHPLGQPAKENRRAACKGEVRAVP